MTRPCFALAFEAAAEECARAGDTIVKTHVRAFVDWTYHGRPGRFPERQGSSAQVHIPTDTAHEYGITVVAWEEDV